MENDRQKWVNLSFLVAGALLAYILFLFTSRIAGMYDLEARVRNADLIIRGISLLAGGGLFLYLYRSDKTNQFMHEVLVELSRVTWPTQKDTSRATVLVIIMVLIAGVALGGLDALWAWMIQWIL